MDFDRVPVPFLRLSVACGALLTAALLALPASAEAQIRGSERSKISQVSDGTTITIDYARPQARGRLPVFGGLVPWGHVWTPGANEATTFEADNDVTLNGVEVPSGRYSVWMVPAEGDWEVVLDPNDALYHTQPPELNADQIRIQVSPDEIAFTEVLTWEFPMVRPTGMELQFRWGDAGVLLDVGIQPTRILTVSAEEAAQIVGAYEMLFEGPPPPDAPPGAGPPPMQVEISFDGDRVLGVMAGAPPGLPNEMTLIPVADFVFNPAWMMHGEIMETEVDMYFEFNIEDGRAVGFDVRGLEDRLMMRGRRTN